MLQAPVLPFFIHSNRVKSKCPNELTREPWTILNLEPFSQLTQALLLYAVNSMKRSKASMRRPGPGFDLDEDQHLMLRGDNVNFSGGTAPVSSPNFKMTILKVANG